MAPAQIPVKKQPVKRVRSNRLNAKMSRTKENFLIALSTAQGIVSTACEAIGISRQTYYNYENEDEEFAKAVEDVKWQSLGRLENKLIENAMDGKEQSLFFALRALDPEKYVQKDRGDVNVSVTNMPHEKVAAMYGRKK